MLWKDVKKAIHVHKPSNVAELEQFCKDEQAKIPPQHCKRLIARRLIAAVAAKDGPTNYRSRGLSLFHTGSCRFGFFFPPLIIDTFI